MQDEGSAAPAKADSSEARSAAALARYQAAQRTPRIIYAAAITVAVVVLAALVAVAYARGEVNNTTLDAAEHALAPVRPEATTPAPARQWASNDTTALGVPFAGGVVVTYSSHSMRGRDALTGDVRWSYTRSDRTLCAALQSGGVAVALYRVSGNCDELTALDAQTGQRRWTRTLDEDGVPFNGTARYQVLGQELMFVSDTAIYAISTSGNQYVGAKNGGVDYWVFNHPGCTINSAVLGQTGALIAQTCHGQKCSGLTHCRNGRQLLLRPATNPTGATKAQVAANPDYITWDIAATTLIPVAAGNSVAAVDSVTDRLTILNPGTGSIEHAIALQSTPGSNSQASDSTTDDADLIWVGGTTYALRTGASGFDWHVPTADTPTVSPPEAVSDPSAPTSLADARVFVPSTSSAVRLDTTDGRLANRYPLPGTRTGRVYPIGAGLLVCGTTTSYYA